MSAHILTDLIAVLRRFGDAVDVDLADDPPTVVTRIDGLVFAAAWPTNDGIAVRLRLATDEEHPDHLVPVEPGSLTFEVVLRGTDDVVALETWLAEAYDTARRLYA